MSKSYKSGKRGGRKHVQLSEWFMACEAWATMKPGPRSLYIELKRRFNGNNNGQIFLSHRDAAAAINASRDTAGGYFAELRNRGFIIVTVGHCLGPNGKGQADKYALTEETLGGATATKEFMSWKKQNPRRKTRLSLAGNSDRGGRKTRHSPIQKSEIPAAFDQKHLKPLSENPAIYTSSHVYPFIAGGQTEETAEVLNLADFCEQTGRTAS